MKESVIAELVLQRSVESCPTPQADSQNDEAPPSNRDIGSTPRRRDTLEQAASQAGAVAARQDVVDASVADLIDAEDARAELSSVRLVCCTHVALDDIDILLAGGGRCLALEQAEAVANAVLD